MSFSYFDSGQLPLNGGNSIKTTTFTTSGTWTKDANCQYVYALIWNGGNGGGSGRQGATTAAGGGSGGLPGNVAIFEAPSTAFGATATVTIGSGGGGGAAQSSANTNGIAGTSGGISYFGNLSPSYWYGESSPTQGAGIGGTTTTTVNDTQGSKLINQYPWLIQSPGQGIGTHTIGQNGGANQDSSGGANYLSSQYDWISGSGGGGSGGDSGVIRQAGDGGTYTDYQGATLVAGGAGGIESGTIDGAAGSPGIISNGVITGASGGGGGGGQSAGVVAGNGGDGAVPGSGGGGGGGSINGTDSGAGGAGGAGMIIVYEILS